MEESENIFLEPSEEDTEDVTTLKEKLEYLERREHELVKAKEELEIEFGKRRAKFKELFLQKEEELKTEKQLRDVRSGECQLMQNELEALRQEIESIKEVAIISETTKRAEIEEVHQKYQNEIASLQQITKEQLTEASYRNEQYESEKNCWLREKERLELDILELRNKTSQDREGVLSTLTKSLKRVGTSLANDPVVTVDGENLEESMKKAQEDAKMLKSVVLPLEEEINSLKNQLKEAEAKAKELESHKCYSCIDGITCSEVNQKRSPTSLIDLDEKVKELNNVLQAEKASRSDLEMYVAVLNTQKAVLQDDADRLRKELQEVCHLLEQEKREHLELKQTWQMANDQFLESQRLQIMDMQRMQSVLTAEQQRKILEMQKKDEERLEQEQRILWLQQMREEQEKKKAKAAEEAGKILPYSAPLVSLSPEQVPVDHIDGQRIMDASYRSKSVPVELDRKQTKDSDNNNDSEFTEFVKWEGPVSSNIGAGEIGPMRRSLSSSAINQLMSERVDSLTDSGVHDSASETRSLQDVDALIPARLSPERITSVLTEAQQKAITDLTPEREARQSLIAAARARTDPYSTVGKRLVSEKEWELLQKEVKLARDKLGRPCDMCSNYETQLQNVQESEKNMLLQLKTVQKTLERYKQELQNEQKMRDEIGTSMKNDTEEAHKQIALVVKQVQEIEKDMTDLRQHYFQTCTDLQEKLKLLSQDREKIQEELKKLQDENDNLIGKHSAHSMQLENEFINLPTEAEEMHFMLLKLKEDLIAAKVAKEHMEESLKSEMMFLKDQVQAEQHAKTTMEDTLTQDIDSLNERLGILQSEKEQMLHEHSLRMEAEKNLKESQLAFNDLNQTISTITKNLDESNFIRIRQESEIQDLKNKVHGLQIDLDNNEKVQRDFVKLSQSLQMELEKLRQADHEVRWQHEEDIDNCSSCKQQFGVTRRKHHCRHCGKIFCAECTSKSVPCGPNRRPAKVCDVCYTILEKNTAPYFSSEPLHTPT